MSCGNRQESICPQARVQHFKSDEAIVAVKPANNAERSAAELVERRAEAKGMCWLRRTAHFPQA